MKKGLLLVLAVAMLFGIVSCAEEPTIVEVTGIELVKSTYYVSSAHLESQPIVVSNILPAEASSKSVTFELIDQQIAGVTGEHYWSEVVKVSPEGVVSFGTSVDLTPVHSTFEVQVSCGAVSAVATFYVNYGMPTAVTYSIDDSGVYFDSTNKVLYLNSAQSATLDYGFKVDEYPGVIYSTPSKAGVISVSEKGVITTSGSGYAEFTVTSEINENATATVKVYVDAVKDAEELKAFLCDALTTVSGVRKTQLNNATKGYIVDNISDLTGVTAKLSTAAKTLDLNAKAVSFTANAATIGFDLSNTSNTKALTINGAAGSIKMENTTSTATLFNVGAKILTINGGTYTAKATTTAKTVVAASGSTVTLKKSAATTFNAEALTATALDLAGTATLTDITVKADGTTAKALVTSGAVTVSDGTYEAIGTSSAIAVTTSTTTTVKLGAELTATSTEGAAIGVKVTAGNTSITDATITANGITAIGLTNAATTTLSGTTFDVDGNGTAANGKFTTVGIENTKTLTIEDSLDMNVARKRTAADEDKKPTDVCAIYNGTGVNGDDIATLTIGGEVNVIATVTYDGAYALYNDFGFITFSNAEAKFTADRTGANPTEGTNGTLYTLYNGRSDSKTSANIYFATSTVSFVAATPYGVDCSYVPNGRLNSDNTLVPSSSIISK